MINFPGILQDVLLSFHGKDTISEELCTHGQAMSLYSTLLNRGDIRIPFVDLAFVVLTFGVSVYYVLTKPITPTDVQILRTRALPQQSSTTVDQQCHFSYQVNHGSFPEYIYSFIITSVSCCNTCSITKLLYSSLFILIQYSHYTTTTSHLYCKQHHVQNIH